MRKIDARSLCRVLAQSHANLPPARLQIHARQLPRDCAGSASESPERAAFPTTSVNYERRSSTLASVVSSSVAKLFNEESKGITNLSSMTSCFLSLAS